MLTATLGFLVFAALALVAPGIGLQRLAGVRVDPALVVPLGTAVTAFGYWSSLVLQAAWLGPALVAALAAAALLPPRTSRAQGPSLRGLLPFAIALVALLAAVQYRWNRIDAAGDFRLDPLVPYDTTFHVGVTRELTLGYPPQVPGIAGFPLGYHLGTDLVRAAALRWAGVDPFDAITRFDVTLWALALALALSALLARLGAPPAAVALAPWILLLTDFSFVFATNPQAHWWSDLLRGNLLVSLTASNPVIPALALAAAALVALSRHETDEGRGWLALAALLGLAVPFFKVFLGAHLVLGLTAAVLLGPPRARAALAAVALPALVATAGLALGTGGDSVEVTLAPLDLVRVTRQTLGLPPVTGVALAAWSALWIVASLGLRLLGVAPALAALRAPAALPRVVAAMALAGWPLGLLFRVSAPAAVTGQTIVNDAAYLVEQSGPLLWLFTLPFLVRLAAARRQRFFVAVSLLLLATPASWQLAWKKATATPDRIPAAQLRAVRALAAASPPGAVVLQRPGARYPPAPVLFASRRVPYERFTPYLTQFGSPQALTRRHEAVYRFFRTHDVAEARAIARSLGAGYLALYAADRVRFAPQGFLEPIYAEPGARVYRLVIDAEPIVR
jgi:hypothetical protein